MYGSLKRTYNPLQGSRQQTQRQARTGGCCVRREDWSGRGLPCTVTSLGRSVGRCTNSCRFRGPSRVHYTVHFAHLQQSTVRDWCTYNKLQLPELGYISSHAVLRSKILLLCNILRCQLKVLMLNFAKFYLPRMRLVY